ITVSLPPLRERREDIRPLAQHFLEQNAAYGRRRLSPVAVRALERYDWPGNVRELQHAIQRAVILCTGDEIQPEDLPPEVRAGQAAAGPASGSLEEIERQHIITTLKQVGGHRAKAARSEEHTSELQSRSDLVCRLLLEKKKSNDNDDILYSR